MTKRDLNQSHQTAQPRVPQSWFIRLLNGALLLFVLTGCASMNKKFTSSTKANIGFFADNTIAILSDVDLSIKRQPDFLSALRSAQPIIQQEIQPYWEDYRATHRELDDLTDKTVDQVKNVRLILLVWVRAHQKMAKGKVNPAEWFDINDVSTNLFRLGTKLL